MESAANQIFGAERWIKRSPERLYLDKSCTQKFPIALPPANQARFHRIVVAQEASVICRRLFGGSGSLMIDNSIVEEQHAEHPFTIGQVDRRGFVHVFDDTTLNVILRKLDTIKDFVSYLVKKERFLNSATAVQAAGEEELLGISDPYGWSE